jgi:hypothetical protein
MNPSESIDQLIARLIDWRGKALPACARPSLKPAGRASKNGSGGKTRVTDEDKKEGLSQSSLLSSHTGCHHLSELLSNQKRLPVAEITSYAERG